MPFCFRRLFLSRLLLLFLGANFCILLLFRLAHDDESPKPWSFRLLGRESASPSERSLFKHHLCVVVPFRNRFNELVVFVPHIHRFLLAQNLGKFSVIVVNQRDRFRFNRASLINVGFFESRLEGCDYFAMHDVDLLPLNLNLSYGFPDTGVYHVSSPEYHPLYHYNKYIGGILVVTLEAFDLVNGMSNKYWGWGLEDDEFFLRLVEHGLKVSRPSNLATNSSNSFRHIHDEKLHKRDMRRLGNQAVETRKRDRKTGLHTLKYRVIDRVQMAISGFQFLLVNVALHCDIKSTPWCIRK
ncbi:Beta 1,4 galactosyltransferase 7 [Trichuris trichiura]|uniref:Beta 1,4 galactosyltransferase 7 n=1 Tax=Trichuris trichiura TaxID=36087 RepID=A0A077ZAE7_TRITR|nr:Beta 1,4 galactosyltransferase 7 [Trichuris trichiura]